MPSNLTAFDFIQEGSQATPGLFNRIFSALSDNIQTSGSGVGLSVYSNVSTGFIYAGQGVAIGPGSYPPSDYTTAGLTIAVSSAGSDYIHFVDSSAARSSYVIGSRVGGTADGLNIWDASGDTMIASFSKQSVRFYQNVVGPVFDTGGALASTLNAATFGTGADSKETRIQSAINTADQQGVARVYIPANMYPYSASSVSFIHTVQMVREGGNWSAHDLRAYGATLNGAVDDSSALTAALAGGAVSGLVVTADGSGMKLTSTVDIPVRVTLRLSPSMAVTSNKSIAFRVNTYSGIVSDGLGGQITSTSTTTGAVIATATPAAQVGSVLLRNLIVAGQGAGNPGTVGYDMRGIANSTLDTCTAESFEASLLVGTSGAVTAYANKYIDFRATNARSIISLANGGANEQTFIGGRISTCSKPLVANGVSGLHVYGMMMESYTVNGPELTDCTGYIFSGVRLETATVGLAPFLHLGTSVGALISPEIGGNAVPSLISAANDSFIFIHAHQEVGARPAGMSGVGGDAIIKHLRLLPGVHSFGDDSGLVSNADWIGRHYRSATNRSNYDALYTAGALKWGYGSGLISSNDDLAAYNFAVSKACFIARASDAAFQIGTRLDINQTPTVSMRTLAASAVTVSAANSNVSANEMLFTIGGDSGASLCIHSGGTVYIFNSAISAKAT